MPLERGALYAFHGPSVGGSTAFVVLTAPTWNMRMSSVGVAMVRPGPSTLEAPHSVSLGTDGHGVGAAIVSLKTDLASTEIGPLIRPLEATELMSLEDRVCAFLQLPALVSGQVLRPIFPGDPASYPIWGDIYRAGPPIAGERKRYAIASPNEWNVSAPYVSVVRLTSQPKIDHVAFPTVLDERTWAACGDLTSRSRGQILIRPRDRPIPKTLRSRDMTAMARGIAVTFRLGNALARAGVEPPDGSSYI